MLETVSKYNERDLSRNRYGLLTVSIKVLTVWENNYE